MKHWRDIVADKLAGVMGKYSGRDSGWIVWAGFIFLVIVAVCVDDKPFRQCGRIAWQAYKQNIQARIDII